MPPGSNRWDRGRKPPRTRSLRRLLILCEDTKSARLYLQRFPFDPNQVQIQCVGTGMNTDSLMEEAIRRKEEAAEARAPFEEIWVVMDRDSFPLQYFNRAFELAKAHADIRACWSNECFELWYLLHFCLRDTGIGRNDMWSEISKHLGKGYDKASDEVFDLLKDKVDEALRNAARLEFQNAEMGEPRRNPSTYVHELVKVLRRHDPEKQAP